MFLNRVIKWIGKKMKKLVVVAFLFAIIGCFNSVEKSSRSLKIIAHRGVHVEAPENTLVSIQKAIDLGLDYVELDVRTTVDGYLVLMHDRTLKRTTGTEGLVSEKKLDEIKQLSAGSGRDKKYQNEMVPTFEQALKLMSGKIGVYVDNKDAEPAKVVGLLEKYKMVKSSVIYSDNKELAEFKKLNSNINIMPEVDSFEELGQAKKLYPKIVAQVWRGFSSELVSAIHAEGFKVYLDILGAGDNPEGVKQILAAGVDGIQTDDPEMVLGCISALE
jgi:glycerophosphoryl diester phosphodiesterase